MQGRIVKNQGTWYVQTCDKPFNRTVVFEVKDEYKAEASEAFLKGTKTVTFEINENDEATDLKVRY